MGFKTGPGRFFNGLWLVFFFVFSGSFSGCIQSNNPSAAVDQWRHNKLIYTKHARCRMDCRKIDEQEVREILEKGKVNEAKSEPAGRPDPKYALEGRTRDDQDVRIVFAPTKKGVVVITVIDLDTDWACNCR